MRRRLAAAAIVLGVVGLLLSAIGTQNLQAQTEPWFVWPAVVVGAAFVVLALDALVLGGLLRSLAGLTGRRRVRYAVVLSVVMTVLSIAAVAGLVVFEVLVSISEYCVPRGWDGCGL